jgi:hypothetical protein|tara:strand:- start:1475 stop:1861 length:387 start_codon:yes stop_codon:yes gene_type:complete
MPIYIYKHPEKEEYIEVLQGMNDEHVYQQDGLAWERVFLAPNASIDSDVDPFSGRQFVDATAAKKGTMGDMMDYSKELSEKRAAVNGGIDPVKQKYYKKYSDKRNGAKHPQELKEKSRKNKNVKIEFD